MVSGNEPWPSGQNPDPDARNRVLTVGSGNNQGVGSIQADALQDHQHNFPGLTSSSYQANPEGPPLPISTREQANETSGPTDSRYAQEHVRVSQGETRAKNMYVYYIIRVS